MSEKVSSCIEDLANEIWLELFDYLDWINLFITFYGLNKRVNQLLMSIKSLSLYSSYLMNQNGSIYIFYKEFPLTNFKQLQHFQLTYDIPYEEANDITQYFPSFPSLISLSVNWNYWPADEFIMLYFRQQYPLLQRLNLNGNMFGMVYPVMDNTYIFHSSSLRYVHIDKVHYISAIQILDQCPRLRSFSVELHVYETSEYPVTLTSRIIMGLTALKKLNLKEWITFQPEFSSRFLGLLLPCCPNLQTFSYTFMAYSVERKQFDPHWWTNVFPSNNKLKRISIELWVRGLQRFDEQTFHTFKCLPIFVQLNANMTYRLHQFEFPYMAHVYTIRN